MTFLIKMYSGPCYATPLANRLWTDDPSCRPTGGTENVYWQETGHNSRESAEQAARGRIDRIMTYTYHGFRPMVCKEVDTATLDVLQAS